MLVPTLEPITHVDDRERSVLLEAAITSADVVVMELVAYYVGTRPVPTSTLYIPVSLTCKTFVCWARRLLDVSKPCRGRREPIPEGNRARTQVDVKDGAHKKE